MKFDLKNTHLDTFWTDKLKNDGHFPRKSRDHSLMTSRFLINYVFILRQIQFSVIKVNHIVIIIMFIIVDQNYFSWKTYQPSNL